MNDNKSIEIQIGVDEFVDRRETEARAKPGANFASVYEQAVYSDAMEELRAASKRHGYSAKDEDAYLPSALIRAIGIRAHDGRKHEVEGTPTVENLKTGKERADGFLNAYKALTGNDMRGGRMSGHEHTKLGLSLPKKYMIQPAELRDNGLCSYVQKTIDLGCSLRNGERDRGDIRRGRASAASKSKTRVRDRGIGD